MKLSYDGTRFNLKCKCRESDYPRQLGLQWDAVNKVLWTTNRNSALLLRRFADVSAKAELGERVTAEMPVQQIQTIHNCLRMLSSVCDGATELDGQGFSKSDTSLGKQLARKAVLTSEQATQGLELVRQHRCQLPGPMLAMAGA